MKKNYLISAILVMITSSSARAQAPIYQWTKSFGGTKDEYVNSIVTDKTGNVYTTGSFEGTIDIDPGPSTKTIISNGASDIFISKQDSKGKLLWSKNMGGAANDAGYSVAVDTGGNVYVTGSFQMYADFGSSTPLYSSGSEDVFVVKYDPSGTLIWVKSIGGAYADYGRSLSVDTLGGLYITGKFMGSVDFDPNSNFVPLSSVTGSEDIFIVKWNQDGIFMWVKGIGAAGYDVGTAITSSPSGEVFATGVFSGPVNFNPLSAAKFLYSEGILDVYIVKYDKDGIFQWAKNFGSPDNDYSRGIAIDNKSNVYVTGYFSGVAIFDPLLVSKKLYATGGFDAFVCKMDKGGNLAWVNALGGIYSDFGYGISVDDNGNVYTTGSFESVADFNPASGTLNLVSNGASDIFISKLDGNGNAVWATNIGGSADDEGSAIFVHKNNDIYSAGDFRNSADFNYEAAIDIMNSNGSADAYVHKMSLTTNSIQAATINQKIDFYPNPTNGIVYLSVENGIEKEFTLSVYDAKGSLIQTKNINSNEAIVDLSGQAAGIYFIQLTTINGTISKLMSVAKG